MVKPTWTAELDQAQAAARQHDELQALLFSDPLAFHCRIVKTPELQTASIATIVLNWYDQLHETGDQEMWSCAVEAALFAALRCGQPHIISRAWKDRANTHRARAAWQEAANALDRAEIAARECADSEYALLRVKYGRMALAYDKRNDAEAAALWHDVLVEARRLGSTGLARDVERWAIYIGLHLIDNQGLDDWHSPETRERRRLEYERSCARSAAMLAEAVSLGDAEQIVRLQVLVAHCLVYLDRFAEAEALFAHADRTITEYGKTILAAQVARSQAVLAIRRDGISRSLGAVDGAHELCMRLSLRREALLCWLSAVEAVWDISPTAPELAPLATRLQIEATRLGMPVVVVDATEMLRRAAVQQQISIKLIHLVRDTIPFTEHAAAN